MPTFYSEVSTLEGVKMYQGNYFVGKPHYEKMEQIFCFLDGHGQIAYVPHVNR